MEVFWENFNHDELYLNNIKDLHYIDHLMFITIGLSISFIIINKFKDYI